MTKQFTYEVEGIDSGFVAGAGEIVDGKIDTDVELVGPQYKLVRGESRIRPGAVIGTASQQNPAQPETAGEPAERVN